MRRESCRGGSRRRTAFRLRRFGAKNARDWATHAAARLTRFEGVDDWDVQLLEIGFVSGCDRQLMNPGGGSDHSVFQQSIGLSVHDSAPLPKARSVHRQYLIRGFELISPGLDIICFHRVLAANPLDACLQLTKSYGGQEQLHRLLPADPSDYASVRAGLSQFRNNICIKQIFVHLIRDRGRLRRLWRSGKTSSKRVSGVSSKSLRLGRAACRRRFHSPIGTRTAVSTPLRVTNCGPCLSVAFRSSLNRALAS